MKTDHDTFNFRDPENLFFGSSNLIYEAFLAITTLRAGIDRRLFDNKVLEQVVRSVKNFMPKEYINDVRKG